MRTESKIGCCIRPVEACDVVACGNILTEWLDATPWMPKFHSRCTAGDNDERLPGIRDSWKAETFAS